MKFLTLLPLVSVIDADTEPQENAVAVYAKDESGYYCEYQDEKKTETSYTSGEDCIDNGLSFGTDDGREPKFCQFHFFAHVVADLEGHGNYKLLYKPLNEQE